jgi:hypothetical protein
MTMPVEVAGLVLGGQLSVAFLAGLFVRLAVMLSRVERQVAALRSEVNGYRTAHENQMTSLDRRLLGLEETSARAANELRMASNQLMSQQAVETSASGVH